MNIQVFDSRKEMGQAAGMAVERKILEVLAEKESLRMVFAAAPSQNEFLDYLRKSKKIPWGRVIAFHMDEYIGLSQESPVLFSNFLRQKLFAHLPFQRVHLIDGNSSPIEECQRYAALIREAPIDVVCMGIGENGHIAFNDPPVADFNDHEIIKKVVLDPVCRQQQVNDGCFLNLNDVPKHALTLTVPTLLSADYICCVVPGRNKRNALTNALTGPLSQRCPASILRLHLNCDLYTDKESYPKSLVQKEIMDSLAKDCLSGAYYVLQKGNPLTITQIKASESIAEPVHYIGPGLVDLQVNGVMGIDFNDSEISVEDIEKSCEFLIRKGVTTFYPTLISNEREVILKILKTFHQACTKTSFIASCIGGIHLEGPFISPIEGSRGAHDQKYVRKPSWQLIQEFQEASGGRIKLITLAPELENAAVLIQKCCENDIKVAIGHSNASFKDLVNAVEAGASLSTHLGNAVPVLLPRHPNILWDQLAIDSLHASLISDGFHLDDAFLKVVLKCKGDKAFLVSDTTRFCGMEPGEYQTHVGDKVELEPNGRLSLKNGQGLLAGASKSILEGVQHLVAKKLTPISQAWKMASYLPALYMEMPLAHEMGSYKDLIHFTLDKNGQITPIQIFKNGELYFENLTHDQKISRQ